MPKRLALVGMKSLARWTSHFGFGVALTHIQRQIALSAPLRQLRNVALEPASWVWRQKSRLRGLTALPVLVSA